MREIESLMPSDAMLELVAEHLEQLPDRIQGFLYADHHVIRDVYRAWGEQELWRRQGTDEATNAAMMHQIAVERLRLAFRGAMACVQRPFPHQEQAVAAIRAALASTKDTPDAE